MELKDLKDTWSFARIYLIGPSDPWNVSACFVWVLFFISLFYSFDYGNYGFGPLPLGVRARGDVGGSPPGQWKKQYPLPPRQERPNSILTLTSTTKKGGTGP